MASSGRVRFGDGDGHWSDLSRRSSLQLDSDSAHDASLSDLVTTDAGSIKLVSLNGQITIEDGDAMVSE